MMNNISYHIPLSITALFLLISGVAVIVFSIRYTQISQRSDFVLDFTFFLCSFILLLPVFNISKIFNLHFGIRSKGAWALLLLTLIAVWYTYESIQLRIKSRN
jgi:hypothetical protein